jgi:hypothetical protein
MSAKPSPKPAYKTDVLTIFLTGNELGALKPCGCSGGQLGGLDRRSGVFNSVPASKRMIVDTGWFVESDSEQDEIKFSVIVEALGLLDYDMVNLTEKDIEMAQNLGLLDSLDSVFNIISYQRGADVNVPAKFTKKLLLKKSIVAVTIAAFDANSAPVEQVKELFSPQPGLKTANILILNSCDTAIVNSIAQMKIVDCLVCPAEVDEAGIIGDPNKSPLVVSVGRYGRYVSRLQIEAGEAEDKLKFSFSAVPVVEGLRPEASLLELYKDYQQFVKDADLLEKQPRYILPNGLEYTGSESCRLCHKYHKYEYEKWSTSGHAHAYATLEKVGSQYDPECIICHVVGLKYESGFVSEQKTPRLKDVGCENCHGPGSKHIKSLGSEKTTGPKSDCTDCHTPETSGEYLGNEQFYLEKIVHWREPNAAGDVKQ